MRGYAAGIGLHLAVAADFAVVADDATFWAPFSDRGFTPDSGGTWLLPRRVGPVRAREMLLLGRRLTGTEAAEWQLVHRGRARRRRGRHRRRPGRRAGRGPDRRPGTDQVAAAPGRGRVLDAQLADEAFALELSSRSEDFREGLKAFGEKRTPDFKGR